MDVSVKLQIGGPRNVIQPLSNILNLSLTFSLSEDEERLLERGLFYIPTPSGVDSRELRRDLHLYHRKLKLLDHFTYAMDFSREPFVNPSSWEPEWDSISEPIKQLIRQDRRALERICYRGERSSNLSMGERKALNHLKSNHDIIIKPADKGSKIVIMDKSQYLTEAYRQLNNTTHYLPLTGSLQLETQKKIREIVSDLYEKKRITAKQKYYLFGEDPPQPRKFYLLPKIHKSPEVWTIPNQVPPGRPIVSDCGSESYRIAAFIDSFLNPLSQKHDSYVKDTFDFVAKIKRIIVPPGGMLFTIDIDSLYTNIDTRLGLKAVQEIFVNYPDPTRPDEALLTLLELGLTRNDFQFDSKQYLQISGTAMGKKFAPAYANIYMANWETTVFSKCHKVPRVYIRYLDDIFGVWDHSEREFLNFITILNEHHASISVKYNLQRDKIEFLDTEVYITRGDSGDSTLGTRVHFKPTDTHALLHKTSYHPKHTYKGIVKSQLMRYNRICTVAEDVRLATQTLFRALRHRGYSRTFLRTIKLEVQQLFQQGLESGEENREDHLVPFISTFSSASLALNSKLKTNFQRIQDRWEPLTSFKNIAAFRRNKNLKDLLVHSSLGGRPKKDKYSGFLKCTNFIENKLTHLSAPLLQALGLQSSNLVYCIECKVCNRLYVGQTKNTLLERLKQHLRSINGTGRGTHLYEHFRTHGSINLSIMGIEAGSWWSDKQRWVRERQWIQKLNTVYPHGLNQV